MMKKLLPILAAALIVLSACESKPSANDNVLLTQFVCAENKQGDKSFFIQMDMPVQGNRPLLDSLRAFLIDEAQSLLYYADDSEIQAELRSKLPAIGDTVSCDMQAYMDSLVNFYAETFKDYDHASSYMSSRIILSTPRYVSYAVEGNNYTGGAHGMHWNYGATFDAETGKELQLYDLFNLSNPDSVKGLGDLISEMLQVQYYEEEPCYMQEDALFEFALPSLPPVLTSQGIKFCYGVYEIGPYAEGAPSCVIPFEPLQPFMTQKARTLLGIE